MFHKEGYKILGFSLLAFVVINLISYHFINPLWLQGAILIVTAIVFLLIVQFFRNPKRRTVVSDSTIVSPVDGKVVVIEEVFEKEFFKEKKLQVSVFMSPINVHVTRYPVNGTVTYSKYHSGKYLVAWHPKSSEENERTTVVIKSNKFGEVLYRQVAGALAKRIVNYAKVGDKAKQGNDSGFIKFGSRVDLYLPLNTKLNVKLNQKVKGGVSIIAKK